MKDLQPRVMGLANEIDKHEEYIKKVVGDAWQSVPSQSPARQSQPSQGAPAQAPCTDSQNMFNSYNQNMFNSYTSPNIMQQSPTSATHPGGGTSGSTGVIPGAPGFPSYNLNPNETWSGGDQGLGASNNSGGVLGGFQPWAGGGAAGVGAGVP